jgi:hypothetical protein
MVAGVAAICSVGVLWWWKQDKLEEQKLGLAAGLAAGSNPEN